MKFLIILLLPVLLFGQIIDEGFEGTGLPTGWTTEQQSPDYDWTTNPLEQTQSLYLSSDNSDVTYMSLGSTYSEFYMFFIVKFSDASPLAAISLVVYSSDATPKKVIYLWTSSKIRIGGSYSTTVLADNTTYYIWLYEKTGSGSDGIYKLWISTTGTKPGSPEINITNDNLIGTLNRIKMSNVNTSGSNITIDRVIVSTTEIGNYTPPTEPSTETLKSKYKHYNNFRGFKP